MPRLLLLLMLAGGIAPASAAGDPLTTYLDRARASNPAFEPSAQRGERFYRKRFAVADGLPGCFRCHTSSPRNPGEHAITGKRIRPMAASANPKRFTRLKKTEKWFRRNCKQVVGRECTAGEKADFITYLKGI